MREKNATPHAAVSRPYLCATAASCHATDRREPKDKAGRRRERGRRHARRRKARTPPLPRSRILVPDTQPVDLGSHSATPVTATPPLPLQLTQATRGRDLSIAHRHTTAPRRTMIHPKVTVQLEEILDYIFFGFSYSSKVTVQQWSTILRSTQALSPSRTQAPPTPVARGIRCLPREAVCVKPVVVALRVS